MEDDIRITIVERAVAFLRPFYDMELLDAPNSDAGLVEVSRAPGGLLVPCMLADVLLKLTCRGLSDAANCRRDGKPHV